MIKYGSFVLSLIILSSLQNIYAAKFLGAINSSQYADYLSDAKGIFIDNDGTIFVTSENQGTILTVKNKEVTLFKTNPSLFDDSDISGIAKLKNNHLVIANNDTGEIALTDLDNQKITKFSKSGDDAGELSSPSALAVSVNNKIYIADTDNDRISVFNSQGVFLFSFGDSGLSNQHLKKPTHIALDNIENVYVMEAGERNRISIYNRFGSLLKQIEAGDLFKVFGGVPDFSAMTVDLDGVIYFSDDDQRKITALNWFDNSIIESFGALGNSQGQFREITQLSINNEGQLAVLDTTNKKVEWYQVSSSEFDTPMSTDVISYQDNVSMSCDQVFAFNNDQSLCVTQDKGIIIQSFDGKTIERFSDINYPTHLHVGDTHVALLEGNQVSAYSLDNKKLFKIGRYGQSPGGFDDPKYVYAVAGLTYVADINNSRIQVFDQDGLPIKQYYSGFKDDSPFESVGQMVVSSKGEMFVADNNGKGQVKVSDIKTGKLIRTISLGEEPYNAEKIISLDLDKQDRLYVLAETDANPYSVSIWQGEKPIIRFGSEEGNGNSFAFNEASNLSVLSTDKNTLLINDKETKKLHRYQYQEIPKSAFALNVNGNKSSVSFNWQNSSPLTSKYLLEGSVNEKGPYENITESIENKVNFKTSKVAKYNWFRIVSVSGFGLTAKPSKPKKNEYQEISQLYNNKDFENAALGADKLLKKFPNNNDLKYLKAKSLFSNKNYRDAINAFQALTKVDEYKNVALKTQVEAYFILEDYLEAKSLIEEVLAAQPKDVQPYLICTELSLKLADAIGAVTCAEDGLELHSDHVKLRYLLGKSYIEAGIPDEGLSQYETIISTKPDEFDIRIAIANDLYDMEMFEEALKHFSFVINRQSFSNIAKKGKAKTLIALERYDEAKTLAIALSGDKTSKQIKGDGYYFLGQIAYKQKKLTEAVLRLTRANKNNPEDVDAWMLLAQSYIDLNKLKKGVKTLNQAIKKNPQASKLYETLGKIELEQSNFPEANQALFKAVSLDPSSLITQKLLSKSLFASRDYSKAATHAAQAARIAPNDIDVLTLQADVASIQGKVGSAIDYLKTAISIKPSSADLQYRLGKIYQDANIFDSSKTHLEKAAAINPSWSAPQVALGNLYLKRRLFDQAIAAYEKAIELEPSEDNRAALNVAFASQKRALEFKNNAPQLVLQDLNIRHVFSAAYKKYLDEPIGKVTLENIGATDYGDLTLSFQIKDYMDFPAIQKIPVIKGSSKQVFDIKAIFNNKILEVDQDTGVQVEVKLSYLRDGQKDDITLTQAMTIYGKNAMIWGDSSMIGSFVTPKDDTLRNFVREVVNKYQPDPGPVNDKLVSAMTYFSSLNAHGTKYIVDPNTPYSSLRDDQVDYVQFPRETLRLKSGDCDDLSVLYSAGLENLGIQTALLEVPGHLLMMFDTGLPISDASLVSRDLSLLAVKDNRVWIPVEVTMIANSFSEAWAEGARKYQKAVADNNLGIISLNDAWTRYKPVTLTKSDYTIELPDEESSKKLVSREKQLLLTKSIDRLILPYQAMVDSDPANIIARMQIAILYSRFGLFTEAEFVYDQLSELAPNNVSILNNKGNFLLLQNKLDEALEVYKKAVSIDNKDGHVQLNLAMAYYSKGDIKLAAASYQNAVKLNSDIKKDYSAFGKLLSL